MEIALFGATGQTGKEFLEIALAEGHTIRALVRTPSKLTERPDNLTVIEGDVLQAEDVDETVRGADIVVSLFGHVEGSPERLQTRGTIHIINAMKKHDVQRIISLSGGGLPYPEKDQPKLADKLIRFVMKVFVPKILNDAIEHAGVLKQSGLDWTIVRAPRLTDEERRGSCREGWVGVNASTKIGRKDLADFILKEVREHNYSGQMPFVSY
ncbi:MAG: NAD(P)H-binding protein [Bacteroidetes bacterium]|jgi:putative NADH-flavin reductase|nr:NAD(P)H-binding protein [Bacteroidota bacterium]